MNAIVYNNDTHKKNVIEWIILHVTAHMMKECLEVVYERMTFLLRISCDHQVREFR